jgi:hypothetical protein
MALAAWLPQVVLLAGLALGASKPASYLAENWLDIPRFLLAGIAIAAYVSTLATLVASFTIRRAYAAAFLIGLFVVSAAVIGNITEVTDPDVAQWIALLSVGDVPLFINDLVFGGTPTAGADAAENLPAAIQVGWYLLVIALSALVVRRRYTRLSV